MDVISLLITIVGIIIILGLYMLGRISRSKMPKSNAVNVLPKIVDENGKRFTSVLDDIPATDGSTPAPRTLIAEDTDKGNITKSLAIDEHADATQQTNDTQHQPAKEKQNASKQHVLFISAKDKSGINGNQLQAVLNNHGLSLGDMDIYHYMIQGENPNKVSLFRVASGIAPWTLKPEDLENHSIPGLSLLMVTPSCIDDRQAVKTFINTASLIAADLNADLKNNQQQPFTQKEMDEFISAY